MSKKILSSINILVLFLATSFTLLHTSIYVSRIQDGLEKYIFRCHDFGQYVTESEDYSKEGIELLNTIETGKEPFLFLIISTLYRIGAPGIQTSYVLIDLVVHILSLLFGYIIVLRLTNKKVLGIIFLLLIGASLVDGVGLNKLFSRQALSNFFLLGLCGSYILTTFQKKKFLRNSFILGIFFGGCLIAHRISFVFASIGVVGACGYYALIKNYTSIKLLFFSVLIGLILTSPYLVIFIGNFIDYIMIKYHNYIGINNNTKEYINSSSLDKSLGVSIVDGNDDSLSALMNFIKNQGFLLIIAISGLKNIVRHIKKGGRSQGNIIFLLIFIVSTFYIGTSLSFSNRVVLTFNIFLLIFIAIYFFKILENKSKQIIIFNLLWILGFFMVAPLTITGEKNMIRRVFNITADPSVLFMKATINPKDAFLLGPHCLNEFGSQLGYKTALNFTTLTMWKQKEKEQNGQINFESLTGQSAALSYSLFENNFMIEQLKNKKLYIIFGPYFGTKQKIESKKIKNQDPYYFGKDYIKLIYRNADPAGYISYIFEVDNAGLVYFSDQNYFNRILGKYN